MALPAWRTDFASSPLFQGLEDWAAQFAGCSGFPEHTRLNEFASLHDIRNARGQPIRFVQQESRCSQRGYEDGIHASGQVPTRADNWHDFFNALIWLAWPATKAALNASQHGSLTELAGGRRGPRSDAATLFDESGLVLVAPDPRLAHLLGAKQWRAAFWEQRPLWQAARVFVIGHAILEKALAPTPGITGKCLFIQAEPTLSRVSLDQRIAAAWQEGRIARPADLFPLPVFGIPGHHPDNAAAGFYADAHVFRPPRASP